MKQPKIFETIVARPVWIGDEEEIPDNSEKYGERDESTQAEKKIDLNEIIELLSGTEEERWALACKHAEGTDTNPADTLECKLEYLIDELTFNFSVTESLQLLDEIIAAINKELIQHFLERIILKVQDRKTEYKDLKTNWKYRAVTNLDIIEAYAKRNIFRAELCTLETNLSTAEVVELADAILASKVFIKKYSRTHVYRAFVKFFNTQDSTDDTLRKTSDQNFKRKKDLTPFINRLKKSFEEEEKVKSKTDK